MSPESFSRHVETLPTKDSQLEKLLTWINPLEQVITADSFNLDGTLNEYKYIETTRRILCRPEAPDKFGEVDLPRGLMPSQDGKQEAMHYIYSAFFGFGHERPSRVFYWILKILGEKAEIKFFGERFKNLSSFSHGIITAGVENYIDASNAAALAQGMTDKETAVAFKRKENFYSFVLDNALALSSGKLRLTPAERNDMLLGIGGVPTREKIRSQALILTAIFGQDIVELLAKAGPDAQHIVVHPLIGMILGELRNEEKIDAKQLKLPRIAAQLLGVRVKSLKRLAEKKGIELDKLKAIAIGTDSILDVMWKVPFPHGIPLAVETELAWQKLASFWGMATAQKIKIMNGFPAPLASFKAQELTEARGKSSLIPVMILPASAVATAQSEIFRKTLIDCAELLEHNKLRIIVQAGCGVLGESVKANLSATVLELKNKYPHLSDNVIIHAAQNADAAIDLFEAMSWSTAPLILRVKNSEMSRMAVGLNIPLLPTGAIGHHEIWNGAFSLLSRAPIFFMSDLCAKLARSLKGVLPRAKMREVMPLIRAAKCNNLSEAVERALAYIKEGKIAETNRAAALQILAMARMA